MLDIKVEIVRLMWMRGIGYEDIKTWKQAVGYTEDITKAEFDKIWDDLTVGMVEYYVAFGLL